MTAVMGLLLASYATVLQPLGWLSAASNVVLAAAGTALMLRPRWTMPGIAAMAGTYVSFFWWQLAGAAGGSQDALPALWFLPPVWAVFALPGVIGVSHRFEGLSDRARSWFASANNGAFFLLFSLTWLRHKGSEDFWTVPAVFGIVLLVLGVLGRRREAVGGSHLAQGLAAFTLAMVLKLEGYHLPLALSVQALGLAFAYARFGGKSELAFSTLAAVIATGLALRTGTGADVPAWSHALMTLLLFASAFPLRKGCDRVEAAGTPWKIGRAAVTVALAAGGTVALFAWCLRLDASWQAPAAGLIAVAWSAFTVLKDRERRMIESGFLAIIFQFACLALILDRLWSLPAWSLSLAGLLCLAVHGLWVLRPPAPAPLKFDPTRWPQAILWPSALGLIAAIYLALVTLELATVPHMLAFGAAAGGLAAIGRYLLPSPVLGLAAAALLLESLHAQLAQHPATWGASFLPMVLALAVTTLLLRPGTGTRSRPGGNLARCVAVASWMVAWVKLTPDLWADIIAASGAALIAISAIRRCKTPVESWVLLGAGAMWLTARAAVGPWHLLAGPPSPHGWLVVLSALAAAFMTRRETSADLRKGLFLIAATMLTAWSSLLVVWHFDWKPVVILWTGLGFLLVSTGLWQKTAILRHCGFALLAMALIKLFAVDVWDFNTFTRIIAFLALGVALVVLGFFYNRFADVLKRLFEEDDQIA